MKPLRTLLGPLADLCWPRICPVETCRRPSDRPERHLCSRCLATLPFFESGGMCRVCGGLVAAETQHAFVCEECRRHPPAFELSRSAVRFLEPARSLILDFKFHKATWLTDDLVDLLDGLVHAKMAAAAIDVVVPVPLHPNRLRERGYNQCGLLADGLARRINRRADLRSLLRVRDTEHQARLGREQRLKNLDGAFKVVRPENVRGRTVLLVDDVSTTGTTLSRCAQALLDASAARVWCATVARSTLEG
ncbi:MAG: ComF family protein [Kiritimatiellia bacterium]